MNNTFAYSREKEMELMGNVSRRMHGACLSLMRYLVLHANHSPGAYAGRRVERGEIVASLPHLVHMTGLGEKTIRNALHQLEKLNEVRKKGADEGAGKGADRTNVYVLVNYELWDSLSEKGQTDGQTEGRARGRQGAASKEEKEEKDKAVPLSPPLGKVIHILVLEFVNRPDICTLKRLDSSPFSYEPLSRQWLAEEHPVARALFEEIRADYGDQVQAMIRPFTDTAAEEPIHAA